MKPAREPDRLALMRALYRGRRIVAVILAFILAFPLAEGALADEGARGLPQATTVSAPAGDLPSSGTECPPGCACPCVCACRGTGAILSTVSLSEVEVESADATVHTPQSLPAIDSPEPPLRPPLL